MASRFLKLCILISLVLVFSTGHAQQITTFPPQIHQQITPESEITRPLKVYNTGTATLDFTCWYEPWGATRDTTVSWVEAEPMAGQVLPGDSIVITFHFYSYGLTIQNYLVNFMIGSNDPVTPVFEVLAMLHVMDLSLFFMPESDSLCEGDSTQIAIAVFGGTENYLYDWTSNPPGFHSTVREPVVSPGRDTWYILEVTDGGWSQKDSVQIKVAPLPSRPAGISGPASVDLAGQTTSQYQVPAVNGASAYAWEVTPPEAGTISGNETVTTLTWNTGFSGTAEIRAAAINVCGAGPFSDAFTVNVYNSLQVSEIISGTGMTIYPNPASDLARVKFTWDGAPHARLVVTDIAGAKALSINVNPVGGENEINLYLHSLKPGYYLVTIFPDDTNQPGFRSGLVVR